MRIYLQHKSSSVVPQKTYWASTKPWGSLCQRPAHFDLKKCADFYIFCWLRNILYLWNNLHNFSTNTKEDTASISILFHNLATNLFWPRLVPHLFGHFCVYYIHVCMYVCMYACMHAWMDGWMDGWMYWCMDVWMYGCMDVWMYGCMDVCMHACMVM